MQYMSSRQEIIKYLYSEKKKVQNDPQEVQAEGSQFKDTVMLENTIFEPAANLVSGDKFERMPKGETVTITLNPSENLEILLSRYACKIQSKADQMFFIDNENRRYELKKGRNVVGRDSVSTIMMDPALRDISRIHIVIEKFDDKTIQITDMSAHGSYLQLKYLEGHTGY